MTALLVTYLFSIVILLAVCLTLLSSIVRGAPYVPTDSKKVKLMVALAEVRPGEKALDLGSGDGRIVIAMAQAGAEAHGCEINPFLVLWSRRKVRRAGLTGRAFIHWTSFWRKDLSSFKVITVFGIPYIMTGLEEKLRQELKADARVISFVFQFPTWPLTRGEDKVYLYRIEGQR